MNERPHAEKYTFFFASLISYHFRSQLWIKIKPMLSCLVCRQTRTARGRGQTRPNKYLIISHRICTPRAKQLEYHPPRKMKPFAIGSGYPLVVTDTHKWIGYNSEDPQLSCEKTLEAGEAEGEAAQYRITKLQETGIIGGQHARQAVGVILR